MIAGNTPKRAVSIWGFPHRKGIRSHRFAGRLLASLLVVVFVSFSAVELCHGWSNSASERAACCSRMANACARVTADECCADKEQRDARQLPPATPQPARDMTAGPLLVAFDPGSAFVVTHHISDARPRVHLLHSVFLI